MISFATQILNPAIPQLFKIQKVRKGSLLHLIVWHGGRQEAIAGGPATLAVPFAKEESFKYGHHCSDTAVYGVILLLWQFDGSKANFRFKVFGRGGQRKGNISGVETNRKLLWHKSCEVLRKVVRRMSTWLFHAFFLSPRVKNFDENFFAHLEVDNYDGPMAFKHYRHHESCTTRSYRRYTSFMLQQVYSSNKPWPLR